MKSLIRKAAKLFTVLATLAVPCIGPSTSHAAICLDCSGGGGGGGSGGSGGPPSTIGTLSGCVTATEARVNPAAQDTGLLWTSRPGDTMPVRRVLLRLRISGGSTPEFFTVTGDDGCYSLTWTNSNSSSFPVSAVLGVIWASPDMTLDTQQTSTPGRLFTIHDGPLYPDLVTTRNVSLNANTTRNVAVTSGEKETAYLTAEEFYARVVRQSTTLLNTMKGVAVHINSAPFSAVTPTALDVHLSGGMAVGNAFAEAHELGHMVAWRSFGLVLAPFRADFLDYMCFDANPTHSWTSLECEKAAWNEGFANMVAAAWMWARSAPRPVIPVTAAGFNLESGACTTPGRNNEGCQAKALWDIYDSRTGDDDGITDRAMGSITRVLRAYPDHCLFDNRCSNEGDPLGLNALDLNALNHLDFRGNWSAELGTIQIPLIDAIYTANSITGGDPN